MPNKVFLSAFFRHRNEGVALIMFALLLPLVLGIVALTIDASKMQGSHVVSSNSTDTSALTVATYVLNRKIAKSYEVEYQRPAHDRQGLMRWQVYVPPTSELQAVAQQSLTATFAQDSTIAIGRPTVTYDDLQFKATVSVCSEQRMSALGRLLIGPSSSRRANRANSTSVCTTSKAAFNITPGNLHDTEAVFVLSQARPMYNRPQWYNQIVSDAIIDVVDDFFVGSTNSYIGIVPFKGAVSIWPFDATLVQAAHTGAPCDYTSPHRPAVSPRGYEVMGNLEFWNEVYIHAPVPTDCYADLFPMYDPDELIANGFDILNTGKFQNYQPIIDSQASWLRTIRPRGARTALTYDRIKGHLLDIMRDSARRDVRDGSQMWDFGPLVTKTIQPLTNNFDSIKKFMKASPANNDLYDGTPNFWHGYANFLPSGYSQGFSSMAGLITGWLALAPESRGKWDMQSALERAIGVTTDRSNIPKPYGQGKKYLILIGSGADTVDLTGGCVDNIIDRGAGIRAECAYVLDNLDWRHGTSVPLMKDSYRTIYPQICNKIKAAGIEIFVLHIDNEPEADVIRQCASSPRHLFTNLTAANSGPNSMGAAIRGIFGQNEAIISSVRLVP